VIGASSNPHLIVPFSFADQRLQIGKQREESNATQTVHQQAG